MKLNKKIMGLIIGLNLALGINSFAAYDASTGTYVTTLSNGKTVDYEIDYSVTDVTWLNIPYNTKTFMTNYYANTNFDLSEKITDTFIKQNYIGTFHRHTVHYEIEVDGVPYIVAVRPGARNHAYSRNGMTHEQFMQENSMEMSPIHVIFTGEHDGYLFEVNINEQALYDKGITTTQILNNEWDTIRNTLTGYSDPEVDSKIGQKANKDGSSVNGGNAQTWRTNLGLEDSTTTTSKIDNLVNKDASNLNGSNIQDWKDKLEVMDNTEFTTKTDDKLNKDGSDLTDQEKKDLRDNLDIYSKDEVDNKLDNKLNNDGSNLSDKDKTDLRTNLDVYSKDEFDTKNDNKLNNDGSNLSDKDKTDLRNNLDLYSKDEFDTKNDDKLNKDGSNLTDKDKTDLRDNINVYSKSEQDTLVNNKVDKNGANLRGDETNKQNWRDKLDTYSKDEFHNELNYIKGKNDNELNQMKSQLEDNKKTINAGIAGSIATANLPQPVDRHDHGLLVGIGTYSGEYGVALGYSKIFRKNVIGKISTSIDSDKNAIFGASIGWHMQQ